MDQEETAGTAGDVAKVFLSYASEDRDKVQLIAQAIERQGWSTFWDTKLIPGDQYRDVLHRELDAAGCVLVLWSRHSVGSRWVRDEASRGAKRGVLVPARIDDVEIPLGFGEAHTANLIEWDGRLSGTGLDQLLVGVERVLSGGGTPPRRRPREDLRSWLRRQLTLRSLRARIYALLGIVGLLLGLVLGILEFKERFIDDPPGPPVMTGDFNVAVTQFGELAEDGQAVESVEGAGLADSLFRELEEAVAELPSSTFQIRVQSPEVNGALVGGTRQARADEAAELAEEIGAHLVIYGTLQISDAGSTFEPEFYLALGDFGDEDLAGQYGLGTPIHVDGNATLTAYREVLRTRLLSRTEALAQFVIGLTRYTQAKFSEAKTHFEAAAANDAWKDEDGKEVAYLFLGNIQGRLGNLDAAEKSYAEALGLEPDYARAQIGAAEVLRAKSCEKESRKGLDLALELYDTAVKAPIQSPHADVATKASIGRARSYQCLITLGETAHADRGVESLVDEVAREFRAVIADFESPNRRVRELAAEAHAGLGLLYLQDPGDDVATSLRRAADEYSLAIEISEFPDRDAVFYRTLGFISDQLNDCEKAVRYYDRAIEHYDRAIELSRDSEEIAGYEHERRQVQAGLTDGTCG